VLKLAIVRVHDDNPKKKDILIERDLSKSLAEAVYGLHLPGFRKRHARKAKAALALVEQQLRDETVKLP